jgi:hypothetical protein
MADEIPKEEAERRAQEVARRMLTTPKQKKGTDGALESAEAILGNPNMPHRNRKAAKKLLQGQ